jgi:hypothetical protein
MNRHKKPVAHVDQPIGPHPEEISMATPTSAAVTPRTLAAAWNVDRVLDPYWAGRLVFKTL